MIIENNPEILKNKDSFLFVAASVYVKIILVLTCFYKRTNQEGLMYEESQEKILEILNWTSRSDKTIYTISFKFIYFNYSNRLMIDEHLNPLVGDLISSVVASISNLVVIHSISWEVHRQFLNIALQMVLRFPSSNHLTLSMTCAYNSLVFIWTERSIGNECDTDFDRQINLIIDCVLERPNSATEDSVTSGEMCLNEVCKSISLVVFVWGFFLKIYF